MSPFFDFFVSNILEISKRKREKENKNGIFNKSRKT